MADAPALVRREGQTGPRAHGRGRHAAHHRRRSAPRPRPAAGLVGQRHRRRRAVLPAARRPQRHTARRARARHVRRDRRDGGLRRAVGPAHHEMAAGRDPRQPHDRRPAVRPRTRREDRRRSGGAGAGRRAVEHVGVVGRALDPQAVPPRPARPQPGPGSAPGAAVGATARRSRRCRARSKACSTASRSPSRCCRTSRPTRPTAGPWPWPACATCWPRPTCVPTRWAATSRARPRGWARPSPSSTTSCAGRWVRPRATPTSSPRSGTRGWAPPWPRCPRSLRTSTRSATPTTPSRRSARACRPSGCTATCTSARPSAPPAAGC